MLVPVYAQTRPPYDDNGTVTRDDLNQIINRIEELEKPEARFYDFNLGVLIALIAVAVTTAGVWKANSRSKDANTATKMAHNAAKKSYEDSKISSEANILLRIEDKFSDVKIKKLMNTITHNEPLLSPNGEFGTGNLHDYLSIFQFIHNFVTYGLLTKKTVREFYGTYIQAAWEHREIKDYVTESNKNYPGSWDGFIEMTKWFSKNN